MQTGMVTELKSKQRELKLLIQDYQDVISRVTQELIEVERSLQELER